MPRYTITSEMSGGPIVTVTAVFNVGAQGPIGPTSSLDTETTPPANQSSTGTKGQRIYASGYEYECVATNSWVRKAVVTTFTT